MLNKKDVFLIFPPENYNFAARIYVAKYLTIGNV